MRVMEDPWRKVRKAKQMLARDPVALLLLIKLNLLHHIYMLSDRIFDLYYGTDTWPHAAERTKRKTLASGSSTLGTAPIPTGTRIFRRIMRRLRVDPSRFILID